MARDSRRLDLYTRTCFVLSSFFFFLVWFPFPPPFTTKVLLDGFWLLGVLRAKAECLGLRLFQKNQELWDILVLQYSMLKHVAVNDLSRILM